MDLVEREISRSRREDQPLSVGFIDLDKFKQVNDQYGHQTGDYVLQAFCRRVQQNLRDYDHFGRYGGEEFLFALVNSGKEIARRITERIRTAISDSPFNHEETEISLTISIGMVSAKPGQIPDLDTCISRADDNLYSAKNDGGDKVVNTEIS